MTRSSLWTRRRVLQQVTGAGALAAGGALLAACGGSSFGAVKTPATTVDAIPARPSVGLPPTMQPAPLVATPTLAAAEAQEGAVPATPTREYAAIGTGPSATPGHGTAPAQVGINTTIDGIGLGMHGTSVLKALGDPATRTVTHGLGTPEWHYANGLTVRLTDPHNPASPDTVWEIAVQPPFTGATATGFRLGDTAAQFGARYQGLTITAPQVRQLQIEAADGTLLGVIFDQQGEATTLIYSNNHIGLCQNCPTSQPTPIAGQALTLRQAWQLALQQARGWSADAAVASVSSSDQAAAGVSTERADAGATGTRALWDVTLIAPSKPSSQLLVQLDNGKVIKSTIQPRSVMPPASTTPPALDSPDAIKAARAAQPPLAPAGGKSHGYAFTLQDGPDGRAVLAIVGSFHGMPARVEFDAASGSHLGTSAYLFSEGGAMFSRDAGQTWRASTLTGRQVQQIIAAPGQPGMAYAVALAGLGTAVSRTTDGGRTWQDVGSLPPDQNPWPTALAAVTQSGSTVLATGSTAGLWLSRDGGVSWTPAGGLPVGTVYELGVTGSRLLASVATSDASARGVYASGDVRQWQRLLPESYRLSTIANGQAAVALSSGGSTTAYMIRGTAVSPLTLSSPALRAAGTDTAGQPFLTGNAAEVALSRDGGKSWTTTLRTNAASIAVAPAGQGAGVALVGGFRTGLFRSADGGRTWRQVLGSASAILPGSDETGGLTFLSPSQVVAAQGATQSWQPV